MNCVEKPTNFWFKIEPYVYVSVTSNHVLLYNTLDGSYIESDKKEVVSLLKETFSNDSGVTLLTSERGKQSLIKEFVEELRNKYMGDVIDVDLSEGKPIQIFPYTYLENVQGLLKKHNFVVGKRLLDYLFEINIYIEDSIDQSILYPFLFSVPKGVVINVIGDLNNFPNRNKLLSFLEQHPSHKNVTSSYVDVITLQPDFENDFSYSVLVDFPIDKCKWDYANKLLSAQTLPFEYIFKVTSEEDCLFVEELVVQYRIEKFQLKPVYTGRNIDFFVKNVFLSKEDILSASMSMEDFFANQSINIYDFGKINIHPNGDIYANRNFSSLGNIRTHSLYDIVFKELEEGQSWLRIRNQAPCNTCVYQWVCPSPSDYEIEIGCPNLCYIKNNV